MDYKDRALAHVRKMCPELMKLSKGCILQHKDFGGVGCVLHRYDPDKRIVWFTHPAYISLKKYLFDSVKIIGHTPHLEHWLRSLRHADNRDYSYFLRGEYWLREYNHGDLREVDTMFRFDLTTGQPATEEDYKAYCEIVGV